MSPDLITRKHTRGVSRAIARWLKSIKTRAARAVLTGAPGIGKTRTLLLILLLLLLDGQNVLYADRKKKTYTWFKMNADGQYEGTRCNHAGIEPTFEVRENDWLLVDPIEKENDMSFCAGKLVLAASANRKHFHK